MLTLQITYHLDEGKRRESENTVQYIKQFLSKIAQWYSQTTDSVTKPTQYTFVSKLSKDIANQVKEKLREIKESDTNQITITITK